MVHFFGYGPLAYGHVMAAVTGRNHGLGQPALLPDYYLGIQKLSQIPEKPRQFLTKTWGENFESYGVVPDSRIAKPISNVEKGVKGIIWTIPKDELEIVKNWFMSDTDWFTIVEVEACGKRGMLTAQVAVLGENQTVDRIIPGIHYDVFPEKEGSVVQQYIDVANHFREDYMSTHPRYEGDRGRRK